MGKYSTVYLQVCCILHSQKCYINVLVYVLVKQMSQVLNNDKVHNMGLSNYSYLQFAGFFHLTVGTVGIILACIVVIIIVIVIIILLVRHKRWVTLLNNCVVRIRTIKNTFCIQCTWTCVCTMHTMYILLDNWAINTGEYKCHVHKYCTLGVCELSIIAYFMFIFTILTYTCTCTLYVHKYM